MGNGADEDVDGDAKQPEGSIRSFAIKNGHVSDNGYQQMKHVVQPAIRNHGYRDRRATCPEVCLFPENPLRHVVLRVYGSKNCGKKTLLNSIDQFATKLESRYSNEPNEGDKNSSKIINFLLNSEQIELETLLESTLENCPFASSLTMYAIVYNVDSRESFLVASSLLSRLLMRKIARGTNIMLVGNKVDLKRNTVVSKLEGACLAKVHQCNFIQVSALYTMNISELWTLILRQVQANGSSDDEEQQQHGWMHKIVNRGRQLAHSAEQIVHKFVN